MSTSKVSMVAVAAAANRLKSGGAAVTKAKRPQPAAPRKIRVCVLSSSYEGADSPTADYDDFKCSPKFWLDRDKDKYEFVDVSVHKAGSYGAIRELVASGQYDVFYNLCDGAKDEKRAGVDVLHALEALNAAYTGGDSKGFEPNKVDMKVLIANANVKTPNFVLLDSHKELAKKCRHLKFPVIVKHMSGYASVGITKESKCETLQQLETQVKKSIKAFNHALVEEFITGREGTVLVCPDPKMPFGVRVFQPLMFDFLADPTSFNHFETKWDNYSDTLSFMPPSDPAYNKVVSMARNAFTHIMHGVGYGRCDFRIDDKGDVYFLEINANCGMYYDNVAMPGGDYADRMVTEQKAHDGYLYDDFIGTQISLSMKAQGLKAPWYCISHDAHGHFSTRASRNVPAGTALYSDPTYPIPVVSKALYTLGEDDATVGCVICRGDGINSVVAIRHSCEPNMQFVHGRTLTFESSRPISKGEELTVDYSTLRDPRMPAFACNCGTAVCRSVIFSDQPTPRVSQQRRKWERRERLLRMRKRASASGKLKTSNASSSSSSSVSANGLSSSSASNKGDGDDDVATPPRRPLRSAAGGNLHIERTEGDGANPLEGDDGLDDLDGILNIAAANGSTDSAASISSADGSGGGEPSDTSLDAAGVMESLAESIGDLELLEEVRDVFHHDAHATTTTAAASTTAAAANTTTASSSGAAAGTKSSGNHRHYKLQPSAINNNAAGNNSSSGSSPSS